MSLFKKLFGQKPPPPPPPAAKSLEQQFDEEWYAAQRRYGIITGLSADLQIRLEHPQTHETMLPHLGMNKTFADWQDGRTHALRRRILFDELARVTRHALISWQGASYLLANCRGDDALEFLEENPQPAPDDEEYGPYCAIFAKTLITLTREDEAVDWARKAVASDPEENYFQTILADALHLSDGDDEAHEIYDHLMSLSAPSSPDAPDPVVEMFGILFARETGALPSPIMAFEIGKSFTDPEQSETFWAFADSEFDDSPHFRMWRAYHLAEEGKMDLAFAKLGGLVMEMPWVREANLNLVRFFEQLDPTGTTLMPEFQAEVRERIRENEWTDTGRTTIEISYGSPNASS